MVSRESIAAQSDLFDLARFVAAQDSVFELACDELRAGSKQSHWMWFIFPQLRGLGHSATAHRFGISSLEEARAFLAHPVLGPRLRECTRLANEIQGRSASQIFGSPDDLKFRSSMTLFAEAAADNEVFTEALRKYFADEPDRLTLQLLQALPDSNGQSRKTPSGFPP